MFLQMKSFWPIRLVRHWAAYLLAYLPARILLRFIAPFSNYKRFKIGRCTVVAPAKQLEIIREGLTHLQAIDPEMYRRLIDERCYRFWYKDKGAHQFLQCREIFAVADSYLSWGKEGVAIFFVQCMLDFNLQYLRMVRTFDHSAEAAKAARGEIQKQVFNWVKKHSFPPELVKHYEVIAKE